MSAGNWTGFEHEIWKTLNEVGLQQKERFILAVSGGLDSMALLEVFLRLKPKAVLTVAHYHHGAESSGYRDRALDLLQKRITELGHGSIHLVTEKSSVPLRSEAEMREARWAFLRGLRQPDDILVTAHHLDDRLETILLKMIRGTSSDGVAAFKMWNQDIFRPFLAHTKSELAEYAHLRKVAYAEDPSNKDEGYLRNWLREKWLPELEKRQPGAVGNVAKSLLKMTGSEEEGFLAANTLDSGLDRQWYVSLSRTDQLRALSLYLKKHQIHQFTAGHLDEIRKRLDKNQKDITFDILGRKWIINASQIMLE